MVSEAKYGQERKQCGKLADAYGCPLVFLSEQGFS